MRIERFAVRGYGHFKERELTFGKAPLHVVFGPNEAGKTTLLSALRDLLFGIPHHSAAGFAFGNRAIELAATMSLERGAGTLDVVRKKARKDPLSGTWDVPAGSAGLTRLAGRRSVDEQVLQTLLAPMDRGLFESVFGFTLKDLEEGGELLRHAGVRELLAGGALGGSGDRVQTVLGSLEEDADALWIGRGKRQPINEALREAKAALDASRSSALGRGGLLDVQTKVAETEEALRQAEADRIEVRTTRLRCERLYASVGLWMQIRDLRRQLDEDHGEPVIADAVEAERLLEILEGRAAAAIRIDQLDQDAEEQEELANRERPDESLLAVAETIESLERRHPDVEARRRDVLENEDRLREERAEFERTLHDLAPGLEASVLEREAWVDTELEPIADCLRAVETAADALRAARETESELQDRLTPDRAALARLDGREDVDGLDAILTLVESYREASGEQRRAEEAHQSISDRCERRRKGLSPSLPGEVVDPEPLLPDVDVVRALIDRRRTIDEAATRAMADRADAERRLGRHTAIDDELDAADVPEPGDLERARSERDAAWRVLREAIEGEAQPDAATAAAGEFESFAETADRTADRMREASEFVARRLDARARSVEAEVDRGFASAALERAERDLDQWRDDWVAAFAEVGVAPDPDHAVTWTREARELGGLVREVADAASELGTRNEAAATLEGALATQLQVPRSEDAGIDSSDGSPGERLFAEASRIRRRRDAALKQAGQRRELEERCARLEAELAEQSRRVEALVAHRAEAEDAARARWPDLGMEATLSVASATRYVERLRALHARGRELVTGESHLDLNHRQVAGFDAQVERLLRDLDRPLGSLTLSDALSRAHRELLEARSQATSRAHCVEAAEKKRAAAAEARAASETLDAEVVAACERFNLDDEDDLRDACVLCVERARLVDELSDAERKLETNLQRGGDAERDREALETSDEAQLQTEAERLGDTEGRLDDRLRDLQQELWTLTEQERALGGDLAVRARSRYEEWRGVLDDLSDRWIELRVARAVLARVVDRFVRDHQPAILERASALVRRLTVDRYVRILQPPGADILALESSDGETKAPDALSTGTHQQMFLALRLAYVLEYAQQAEPLPLVMDDVLVNVDEDRQAATLDALAEVGKDLQVIYFTCHEGLVERVKAIVPSAGIQTLERPGAASEAESQV